ncbi:MAG: IclR family transcriptional regulator [Ectothiorhodospiraceae bacterium]|nr:IclR family transcriptional regulator [Ectothiorhodospiraceae bacterium]
MTKSQRKPSNAAEVGTPANGPLLRGLSVLRAVLDAPAPMTLAELADRTGLDSSTTLRLAQTLAPEGYLVRHEAGKRYSPGPRALNMLSPYHPMNTFRRETADILQQLRDHCGETIGLIVFVGTERLIVDIAQGREALAPFYDTWLRTPLHAAASGKLLLATMGPRRLRSMLGAEPFAAPTQHTITSYEALDTELTTARLKGYAQSIDEVHVGLTAIAAPVQHEGGTLGCIVTVGSSTRLSRQNFESAGDALSDAAALIGAATPSVRPLAYYLGV